MPDIDARTSGKLAAADVVEINPMYLFRWEETQNAHVLLYPEGVVKLNATAAEVLKRCTGAASVGDIVRSIQTIYVGDQVADDVRALLELSYAKGWIRRKS